jgi:drug/metabolite transporter (DMT)-like permease
MRVAVEHIPPFVMGGVRYLIAGPLMLAWCAWSGRNIRLTGRDFRSLLAVGVLLLTVGNMGVAWAEVYVPSGLAALIVALVPIWVAMIQAWIFKSARLSLLGLVGLALGIVGLVVLLWPRIKPGTHLGQLEMFGVGLLVLAALGWAMGSVLAGRWTLSVDVFTSSAWQMTIGGSVNLLIALITGQFHQVQWTARGIGAVIYLVICGSWIGFSAYGWLLEHVATPKVATYAYVNPVVAVYLGWLFLNEKIDGFMLAGTVIIVGAVALVNLSKLKSLRKDTVLELPLVEPAGD